MSLRARTTLLVAVVTAVLLVGGAITLDVVLRQRLTGSADDLARSRVADLLALAEAGDLPPVLVNVTDDSVAQVVDDRRPVVAASPNASGAGPLTDEPATGGCASRSRRAGRRRDRGVPAVDLDRPGRRRDGSGCTSAPAWSRYARQRRTCARPCWSAYRWSGCCSSSAILAAGRAGAAAARPDPRRGRHHHRVRPRPGGWVRRAARRGRPAGGDDEPDARAARAGRASGSAGSSPTSPTTCAAR